MTKIKLTTPLTRKKIASLKTGDEILLSGVIVTARDAAHKKLVDMLRKGRKLPIALKDAVIYYAGPAPTPPGMAIGSCGPTTSSRMDEFTPALLEVGLGGMIGKGDRSAEVIKAIKKHKSIYFIATGGLGAFLATKVVSSKCILFKELGPEAVYELEVEDFPLIVAIDQKGRDIYEETRRKKK